MGDFITKSSLICDIIQMKFSDYENTFSYPRLNRYLRTYQEKRAKNWLPYPKIRWPFFVKNLIKNRNIVFLDVKSVPNWMAHCWFGQWWKVYAQKLLFGSRFSAGWISCIFHKVTKLLKIQSTYFGMRHVLELQPTKKYLWRSGIWKRSARTSAQIYFNVQSLPKHHKVPSAHKMYVNFLMFNYFRPPTFSQILYWWSLFYSVFLISLRQWNYKFYV